MLEDAVDELYSADLDQFVERRKRLAADAKSDGDPAAAKEIAALRKPTQAAFTVNRLARTDPDAIERLVGLGTELQQAQRSADAAALRELNRRRRTELNQLVRRAFDVIGQQKPSAGQREEVAATLQAALADPDLATKLQQGTLVRAAESSGFGFTPPELTLVRRPTSRSDRPAAEPADEATNEPAPEPKRKPAGPSAKERAATATAERRAAALDAAQAEVDAADTAVADAVAAIDKDQQLIRALQRTLSETKQQLDDHKTAAKSAEARQRKAREVLNRLR